MSRSPRVPRFGRRGRPRVLGASVALLLPCGAFAGEALEVRPDRPVDCVVPGHLQVEAGVGLTLPEDRKVYDVGLLLRYGLAEVAELRLAAPGYALAEASAEGASSKGFGDLAVGTKLAPPDLGPVALSVVLMVSLPTGEAGQSSEGVDPSAGLNFELPLGETFALSGGVAYGYGTEAEAGELGASVGVGAPIGEAFGAYVEGALLRADGGDPAVGVGAGATWQPSATWQIDLSFLTGVSGEGLDPTIGLGVATVL